MEGASSLVLSFPTPTFEWFSSLFPDRTLRSLDSVEHRFKVDVILPSCHNPRDLLSIPLSKANPPVIAILPHPNANPQFEITTIPSRLSKTRNLSSHGKGQPVLYSPELTSEHAAWLNIRLSGFHSTLRFYSQDEHEQLSLNEPCVSIRFVQGGEVKECPLWECPELFIDDILKLEKAIDVDFPTGLEVTLKGKQLTNNCETLLVAKLREPKLVQEKIKEWLKEGCFEVEISAGALGKATLSCPLVKLVEESQSGHKVTDKEIEERLIALEDGLPLKANWPVVRKVLDLPPGTNHSQVKSAKKQVRMILKRLRGEK